MCLVRADIKNCFSPPLTSTIMGLSGSAVSVTSSRDAWTMRQVELVDISREYNQKLVTFPSNVILKMLGFQKIVPNVITSSSTEKAFETGKDDETKVFEK